MAVELPRGFLAVSNGVGPAAAHAPVSSSIVSADASQLGYAPAEPSAVSSGSCSSLIAGAAALATAVGVASKRRALRRSGVSAKGGEASEAAALPKARVPPGTPAVEHIGIRKRPRRNRRTPAARKMFTETSLSAANFILPLFVHDGEEDIPISSMPGVSRLGVDTGLIREVKEARELGVKSVVIFPKTPDNLKTATAEESWNPNGLAQRAIRNVKKNFPDVIVYTDVALDPYNSLGHDGIVQSDGVIMNDETIHQLCKQAVSQAEAGADYVSPSDMMDGRVGELRDALDNAGFTDVGIMSYSAKYASAFYGPFREALDSNPRLPSDDWTVFPGKETYQQDPGNYREALLEAQLDEAEGADILMVKPGLPYLDVIKGLHEQSNLPIAAYHVSGEYAMLKAAAQNGWLDEKRAVLEALLSIKRAGATVILTYYAKQAAIWLKEQEQES
eukprot:TRINITY_DN17091_c0_g1_i1.p1 TRINITY_DN17091_c0_g1~~TRINITY_DN17091_c0_g1_i1.p1  ORF type:complete len:447 (-),score=122.89 TRINITY_DN17091_c0_g1_i1:115-1455(-)